MSVSSLVISTNSFKDFLVDLEQVNLLFSFSASSPVNCFPCFISQFLCEGQ